MHSSIVQKCAISQLTDLCMGTVKAKIEKQIEESLLVFFAAILLQEFLESIFGDHFSHFVG